MTPFEPFREYSRADAVARLGEGRQSGKFFVGRTSAACFAELGPAPRGPSFPERSTFHWPGKCPEAICSPIGSVHLFVRRTGGTFRFQYVGEAFVTSYGGGDTPQPVDVHFRLRPPLTRERWLELWEVTSPVKRRGVVAEADIARLTPASTTADRVRALCRFVEEWHGDGAAFELPALTGELPPPLEVMHGLTDLVPGLMVFNSLLAPDEMTPDDGKLVFYVENQGVCLWATEPRGDDPAVWWRLNEVGEAWQREGEPLSGFLIQLALFESIMGAPAGGSASSLSAAAVERLCARMKPLPLAPWRWMHPARFHARDGALLFVSANDDEFSVWVAAREPGALSFMADLVDDSWEQVSF